MPRLELSPPISTRVLRMADGRIPHASSGVAAGAGSLGRLGQARLSAFAALGTGYGWPKRPPLGTGKLAGDLHQGSWYQIVELRAAQKISTAWVAAAAMIDRCAGVLITSSSSRFTIEPASNRTAGIRVLLSTMSWS